jgi:uncharacterized protein YkwD
MTPANAVTPAALLLATTAALALTFGLAACGDGPAADDRSKASSTNQGSDAAGDGGGDTGGDERGGDAGESGDTNGADAQADGGDWVEGQDKDVLVIPPTQTGTETGAGTGAGTDPVMNPIDPTDPTVCYKGDAFVCDVERRIVALTNELRGSTRAPLTLHPGISFVARDWSAQQAASGNISHTGFPGARQSAYQAEFGASDPVSIQAENVAYSYARDQGDAAAIAKMFVDMWAGSAGHRRNMLGGYQFLGVGIAFSGSSVYATQIFGGPN